MRCLYIVFFLNIISLILTSIGVNIKLMAATTPSRGEGDGCLYQLNKTNLCGVLTSHIFPVCFDNTIACNFISGSCSFNSATDITVN